MCYAEFYFKKAGIKTRAYIFVIIKQRCDKVMTRYVEAECAVYFKKWCIY